MRPESQRQANKLLHNKLVVVLGDSIQRSVYKDLVLLLQRDSYLSLAQLKSKGEFTFEGDFLVEGGRMGKMNNGTAYREVRQYRTDHHLVRFYFVTQVFSSYMDSILKDFENGMKPDLVIVNSCVWDVSRYRRDWASEYKENLLKFFRRMKSVLPEESLVIWNMTMPLGKKIIGGFLVPEIQHMGPTLRFDVIEANYFGATLASQFGFDVLDLHFQFRFSLQHRMADGVHWNAIAHRSITSLLLEHIAEAWGVEMPKLELPNPPKQKSHNWQMASSAHPAHYQDPYSNERCYNPHQTPTFHYNSGPAWMQNEGMQQFSGFGLQSSAFDLQFRGFDPQFCTDSIPPHLTVGYQSFERQSLYRAGNNSAAAPSWPVKMVTKQKHRRHNPYTREKPRSYRY